MTSSVASLPSLGDASAEAPTEGDILDPEDWPPPRIVTGGYRPRADHLARGITRMLDRLPLLALFALSLVCPLSLDAAEETAGNVERKARHSFPSDGAYDTNFFGIECMAGSSAGTASTSKFMTKFSDALADAGVDYRVEQDGSISYRSEDEDAVFSIVDDMTYAPVVDELRRSEDLSCKDAAQSD